MSRFSYPLGEILRSALAFNKINVLSLKRNDDHFENNTVWRLINRRDRYARAGCVAIFVLERITTTLVGMEMASVDTYFQR